jgi:hypothetical protein
MCCALARSHRGRCHAGRAPFARTHPAKAIWDPITKVMTSMSGAITVVRMYAAREPRSTPKMVLPPWDDPRPLSGVAGARSDGCGCNFAGGGNGLRSTVAERAGTAARAPIAEKATRPFPT